MKKLNKNGFTIVELMIASSAFSLMLLVVLGSVIYLGKLYYKGVTVANTVEVNRSAIEDVSQAIQFSGEGFIDLSAAGGWDAYCISGKKYSYKIGVQLREDTAGTGLSNEVFIVSTDSACTAASNPAPVATSLDRKELLKENMRLTSFNLTATAGGLTNIELGVVYGGDPSLPGDDAEVFNLDGGGNILTCKGSSNGSAFCATSFLSTSVTRRVN